MWDRSGENMPLVTTLKYVWFLIYQLKEVLKESFSYPTPPEPSAEIGEL